MDDKPLNRRLFFRHGLRELLRPLNKAAAPLEEVIRQIGALEDPNAVTPAKTQATPIAPAADAPPSLLSIPVRPPGALPEQKFRETCSRCGECVRVCPVHCIKIDPAGFKGAGAPFIEIDEYACVLCDGLHCMNSCPSGALLPIPIGDIDMGTAVWHEDQCLRSHGEGCTFCIDQCPIGEMAIVLEGEKVKVIEAGCTGCGVCQNRCPTSPKSITITPRPVAAPATQSRGRPR
jgi:ferredoxin-type protein NapG